MGADALSVDIDFGTTSSATAPYSPDTNQVEILHNVEGEAKTPSLICLREGGTLIPGGMALLDGASQRSREAKGVGDEVMGEDVDATGLRGRAIAPSVARRWGLIGRVIYKAPKSDLWHRTGNRMGFTGRRIRRRNRG